MTRDIDEFAKELSDLKTDSKLNWAGVREVEPMRRDKFYDAVSPTASGASDLGLAVTFETASGREFEEWFEKPDDWDLVRSNLVLLLEFWGLDPGEIERLETDDDIYEIPLREGRASEPEINWAAVERSIHTKQLEEADDAPE